MFTRTTKLAIVFAALATPLAAFAQTPATLPEGVAAGDVTTNSVVLWARSTVPGTVNFELSLNSAFSSILSTVSAPVTDTNKPAKVDLSSLASGTRYYYRAANGADSATGTFKTAAAGGRNGLRFGVSGDWRGELAPYPAIKNAAGRNLDFFVNLGDTVYQDISSLANAGIPQSQTLPEFRNKFKEVYGNRGGANTFAALRSATPSFSVIDDHEVTNDFEGFTAFDPANPEHAPFAFGATPAGTRQNRTTLFNDGLQSFREYHPVRENNYASDLGADTARMGDLPDLYRKQAFGKDASIFLLDARSFRDAGLPAVTNPADPAQAGAYIVSSLVQTDRTMLGKTQLNRLKSDLLASQAAGTTWKFIHVPEPIQNLGVLNASDRFEGYGAERTEILKFIDDNQIDNVVFVAADIHGSLINDLSYQQPVLSNGVPVGFTNKRVKPFEVTTGSVAFSAPFGPTVLQIAESLPIIPGVSLADAFFAGIGLTRPQFAALDPVTQSNLVAAGLINPHISALSTPIGLQDSGLNVISATPGAYANLFTFGWTEFQIDAITQNLTVNTYGLPWYDPTAAAANPVAIAALNPSLLSSFTVAPIPEPASLALLAAALPLPLRRRR